MLENALKSPCSHLVTNHLPIFLLIMGCFLLLFGFLFKNGLVKRLALSLFVFAGIAAFFSMNTGEGAEEIVGGLEKTSGTFLLSAISILSIWLSWKKNKRSNALSIGAALMAIFAIYLGVKTATSGGGNNT
jgi:uncharacterized membrane protein